MNTFHNSIAAVLVSLFHNPPTSHVIAAPECGGNHRIRLFSTQRRSRATNYCWPDLVITLNGEVRIILEIEEAGIATAGKIGSKLFPVSLSKFSVNEDMGLNPIPIARETAFIQVVNTAALQPGTRKLLQYKNLQADIRGGLPLGCVAQYFLFPIEAEKEPPFDTAKLDALLSTIHELLPIKHGNS